MTKTAVLALEDGSIFRGVAIGSIGATSGEVVFNTAMTGYQEILTDPSYSRQIVTLTYPHIGNTGITPADDESPDIHAAGLVIKDLPLLVSNWRSKMSLDAYLKSRNIVAIAGIDTRRLTRILRETGAQNGCIMAGDSVDEAQAVAQARAFPGLTGMAERGCRLTVVPATTPASEVLAMNPDGVFLSNGPGDPQPCDYAIAAIKEILATSIPVFGICLGHQLLALASGARTEKMKFGHHGANHPVQDLNTGQVMITSQNHGFAVAEDSLPENLVATHKSLFDGSLQGIERTDRPAFSFQGHPEASPGPHDVAGLFDRFVDMLKA